MSGALLRCGEFLRGLRGWRALLAAALAGAVYALGFAPLEIFPAMLFGLAALVVLLDGAGLRPKPVRRAALLGWGFGFGQFTAGMHWIFYPFLVDPAAHAWEIPFVALLFPGGLALFVALSTALAMPFWHGRARVFVLAAAYAGGEWLRGHVLTGLPWNLPAYGWGASLGILQSSAVLGAYGLSLLTVLFGFSLAEVFSAPRRWVLPAAMAGLFAVLWIGGDIHLAVNPPLDVPGVRLRLVQPNIPQNEKYLRPLVARNWGRLIGLSTHPAAAPPTVIIWPEAAPPVLLQRAPVAMDDIAVTIGTDKILLTGNERLAIEADGSRRFFNSFFVFGPGGALLATYDKFHLVPFGEYLPYEFTLRALGITRLVGFPGSFSAGDGPHTVKVPGAPAFGPLICYEILFPGAVVGDSRPQWLVNVTDDSWFGPWAGPRQHLLAARVRAIEEALPVVRAANTGISAVIDAEGRVTAMLGLGRTGYVDAPLPKAAPRTVYARYGDLLFLVLFLLCLALAWASARMEGRLISV
ncbi:MAG TPA: apolipoprotein N-acyltransferase [Rhizomicrobium sp.]